MVSQQWSRSLDPNGSIFFALDTRTRSSAPVLTVVTSGERSLAEAIKHPRARELFCLGRAAAHRALSQAGYRGEAAILRGTGGEPLFPDGFSGSLSHTVLSDRAPVAVAAVVAGRVGIGVDLERVDREAAPEIAKRIASEEEQSWIGSDCQRLVSLLSAKEAVFKALYPLTKRYFGFLAVRLSAAPGGFRGELSEPLSERYPSGFPVSISQEFRDGAILSWVVVPC